VPCFCQLWRPEPAAQARRATAWPGGGTFQPTTGKAHRMPRRGQGHWGQETGPGSARRGPTGGGGEPRPGFRHTAFVRGGLARCGPPRWLAGNGRRGKKTGGVLRGRGPGGAAGRGSDQGDPRIPHPMDGASRTGGGGSCRGGRVCRMVFPDIPASDHRGRGGLGASGPKPFNPRMVLAGAVSRLCRGRGRG